MTKPKPPAEPRGLSRARGDSDAIVLEIMTAMGEGSWRSGISHAEFAAKWNVSLAHMQDLASEAGRNIRLAIGNDREAIIGAIIAQIEAIGEKATRIADLNAALKAIDLKARLLKLIDPPQRAAGPHPWASLAPGEQLARIAAARAQLDALEQNIRAALALPAGEDTKR